MKHKLLQTLAGLDLTEAFKNEGRLEALECKANDRGVDCGNCV